nr:Fibroblast growth factor [Hyphantria cunea nucleopolyhedrovirus]UIX56396.1 Fibroblast growth factor [Hyphantria cunea nucleopolyhedrovirus]
MQHITGTQRLTHVVIRNRFLAVRPDGVVNGTTDASDLDIILQRVSYHYNRILLRNAISCMYVCLDRCGTMYASAALSSDCILNEIILDNNYDVMFKIYDNKKTYVALNDCGQARRVQLPKRRPLRNMSAYTLILRAPINYFNASKCPKQKKIFRHRKCHVAKRARY